MTRPIAVLASMEQESRLIEARLEQPTEVVAESRRYVSGTLRDREVVTAVSGFGKVAAAATTAWVLDRYAPTCVIFGGVAGGLGLG
ncbi:MAG: 5'-methylthioadenosine/S-adenosylhomocysteine nucleosidase, partial [Acidimicrobiia bacterium]|nr:5'-methylthioadenosine/S-adenosylhomocysteine nucleosidase [Acidimicrobiia bacterium]